MSVAIRKINQFETISSIVDVYDRKISKNLKK